MNESIESYLKYYSKLENPQYAVLIKGGWGSGKTWFVNKFIENQSKPEDYILVSLYGISNASEIEELIFQEIHPVLSSKEFKLAGKIFKGLLKATIKFDIDEDKTLTGSINPNISKDDMPNYLSNLEKKVLVFDDLERCNVDLSTIMGYLNQYVERLKCKLIIIAHEEEVIKKWGNKKDESSISNYLLVKEKLIGQTFELKTDIDKALSHFIKSLKNSSVKKLLQSKKKLLKSIYFDSKYGNLRFIRQSILDFQRFYGYLPIDTIDTKKGLLDDIISFFFALSIELRHGKLSVSDLAKYQFKRVFIFHTDYASDYEKRIGRIMIKYKIFRDMNIPFSIDLFTRYVKYSEVDRNELEKSIKNNKYFEKDNIPDWRKLLYYLDLDDEQFVEILSNVLEELKNNEFLEQGAIIHTVGILIFLIKNELLNESKGNIIQWGENNIKLLAENNLINTRQKREIMKNSSYSIQYMSLEDTDFQNFLHNIEKVISKKRKEEMTVVTNKLVENLKQSIEYFGDTINFKNLDEDKYQNTPVLSFVSLDAFFNTIIDHLSNKEKRELGYYFEARYDHVVNLSFLSKEMEWLHGLIVKIEDYHAKNKKTISGVILYNQFRPVLLKCIKKIKDSGN